MNRETLEAIYRGTLASVHYSSIAQFFEYLEGKQPDPRFGTSCGFQALAVGKRLEEGDAEGVQYFMDGRHAAVTCYSDTGDLYLFDPYLLHADPINLSNAVCPDGQIYDAYPYAVGARGERLSSQLRVRYFPAKKTISLEYMRLSATSLTRTINRYFKLRLDRPVDGPPPASVIAEMLYHPEQNNLSVRVLNAEDGTLSDLIYPICYYHGAAIPVAEHLLVRTSYDDAITPYADRDRFTRSLERMALVVKATAAELIEFVLEGARIYERHAPSRIDYLPYMAYKPEAT
ncbi:MAG: hypothetical protein RJA70_1036 [Pseudomonadota bacterium]|jgi:hypothetical protein